MVFKVPNHAMILWLNRTLCQLTSMKVFQLGLNSEDQPFEESWLVLFSYLYEDDEQVSNSNLSETIILTIFLHCTFFAKYFGNVFSSTTNLFFSVVWEDAYQRLNFNGISYIQCEPHFKKNLCYIQALTYLARFSEKLNPFGV